MKRRDLLKGLCALPLSSSWKGTASKKKPIIGAVNKFELVLDGPFALVFQQSKPDRLYAFSPVEKSNLHAFFISDTSGDSKKKHTLSLVSGAGALNANNGFPGANDDCMNAFSWHSNWDSSPTDNLVEIDIPVPSRIICDTDTVTPGQFENGTLVGIPQGHILEYDVLDATKTIKISDPLMGDFKPYKSPTPNAIRIRVEIGLWRALGKDPDPVGTHAVSFHNDSLLQRFPNQHRQR